jgi:alcohol dehydrogenase YqhD (iron-dependent ADH family)
MSTLSDIQLSNGLVDAFIHISEQYLTCTNTTLVNDGYAEYIQQLLLSEKVTLLDYENNTLYTPVNVQTKSLKKQTGLNDGTMNYELTFDFAYDLINNVV